MWHKLSKYFLYTFNHSLNFKNILSSVESTNKSHQTQVPWRKIQVFCVLKIHRNLYDTGFFQSNFKIAQLSCLKVHCTQDHSFYYREKNIFKIQRQNSVAEISSTQNSSKMITTDIALPHNILCCRVSMNLNLCLNLYPFWSYTAATVGTIMLIFLLFWHWDALHDDSCIKVRRQNKSRKKIYCQEYRNIQTLNMQLGFEELHI